MGYILYIYIHVLNWIKQKVIQNEYFLFSFHYVILNSLHTYKLLIIQKDLQSINIFFYIIIEKNILN